ncbi:MAG: peptidoglycan-binding protein [Alkalinema sp. RU_4_3]|nr:peptidoglycan-binding protein [Alkalinema sp. RU_4_3]
MIQANRTTLFFGTTGTAVRELQTLLRNYANKIGSRSINPGTIDGLFGLKTEAAVQAFQRQVFLPNTGVVDEITWRSLIVRGPVDLPELRPGMFGDAVIFLQVRLTLLELFHAPIDSEYGETTRSAVVAFQQSVGLSATGVVDQQTWGALSARAIDG